jgi:acetyl-CoA acetyltransferase
VAAFRRLFGCVDVDPAAVDDVIVGCVDAIGGQAGNIGRNTWLAAPLASTCRVLSGPAAVRSIDNAQ